MTNESSPQWLKVKDVAARLDITPMSVYRLINAGKLPATRATPRSVRVRAADLEAYLEWAGSGPSSPRDPWDEYMEGVHHGPYIHPDAVLAEDFDRTDFFASGGTSHVYVLAFGDGSLYAMFPGDTDPEGLDAAWAVCRRQGGTMDLLKATGGQP